MDGNDNVINDACIQINAIVTLPSTNALSSLDIALTNNNIHVESAFSFDDLSLAVVNGGIEINEVTSPILCVSIETNISFA